MPHLLYTSSSPPISLPCLPSLYLHVFPTLLPYPHVDMEGGCCSTTFDSCEYPLFSSSSNSLFHTTSASLFDVTPKEEEEEEEEDDDPFSYCTPFQCSNIQSGIFNWHFDYTPPPLQDCVFPHDDVFYPPLDHPTLPSFQDDWIFEWNSYSELSEINVEREANEISTWSGESNTEEESVNELLLLEEEGERLVGNYNNKRADEKLSFDEISEYFYHPITHAAKGLKVGLTLLKKRCRELGIKRWPHRKLTSMLTLINNVQEMVRDGDVTNAVDTLHKERKLMEMNPDSQLLEKTKKLRQACFKANYKKKKQISFR